MIHHHGEEERVAARHPPLPWLSGMLWCRILWQKMFVSLLTAILPSRNNPRRFMVDNRLSAENDPSVCAAGIRQEDNEVSPSAAV